MWPLKGPTKSVWIRSYGLLSFSQGWFVALAGTFLNI